MPKPAKASISVSEPPTLLAAGGAAFLGDGGDKPMFGGPLDPPPPRLSPSM